MPPANHIETEVKFHLPDPDGVKQRLRELGAAAAAEHFETNIRFEDPEGSLMPSDRLLRLRMDSACRLTFKKRPAVRDGECKTYRELEVEVSDFETMAAILHQLGFAAVQRYDKRRQVFTWQTVELCIDTMPFGTFLEIEGDAAGIKNAAAVLSFPWEERILTNYLAIFDLLRKGERLPFNDVTFENFAAFRVDVVSYLPRLWARGQVDQP